jgi:predicted peroxiredoxin
MAHEQTLGICVATKASLAHVLGLARAARKAGKEVNVFFTGEGVLLTQDPSFNQLLDVAKTGSAKQHGHVTVCEVSYIANGLKGKPVPGLRDKDFVTQGKNAEMVEECQRYVVL